MGSPPLGGISKTNFLGRHTEGESNCKPHILFGGKGEDMLIGDALIFRKSLLPGGLWLMVGQGAGLKVSGAGKERQRLRRARNGASDS